MLGRLARWLRVIGADTLQLPVETPDRMIVARANSENRVLLTRDRLLVRDLHPDRSFEVKSEVPLEQLAEVVHHFGLTKPPELFVRCLLCNEELVVVPPVDAAALIPPRARASADVVRQCPACQRVYWRGSHARRMEAALAAALPGW